MRKVSSIVILAMAAVLLFGNQANAYAAAVNGDKYSKIDQYLEKECKAAHLPGMAVVLVDKDKVLFSSTYGNCTSLDAPFFIGSNSKSFTAVSILQLVEQGKIELDASISTYLPNANEGDKITVRQLLNHTSGIRTYDTQKHYKVSSGQGTHVYANTNYGLLGQIVEAVSGSSYCDYVSTNIFQPLGMSHSFTSLEEAKKNGLITGYRNYFGLMLPEELPYPDVKARGWVSIPAGYLLSSASDMGRYLQFYLRGGENILQPESIQSMFGDSVKISSDREYGFGWGIRKDYPEMVISHNGLVENYSANMFILPDSGIAGVILMNMNDYLVADDMTGMILHSVLEMLFDKAPVYIKDYSYLQKHLLMDGLYLLLVVLCILPILFFRRWKKAMKNGKKTGVILSFLFFHILLPTILLLVPVIVATPMFVIKAFVPDLYLVLVGGAAVAYGVGLFKIIYILKTKKVSKH